MAEIVLGIGISHSPQLGIRAEQWSVMRQKDENDRRLDYQALLKTAKPDIDRELTPEKMKERDDACQNAIGGLSNVLKETAPDVMLVLGDDQHEQFLDDVMPMLCIYHGESLPIARRRREGGDGSMFGSAGLAWRNMERDRDEADENRAYDAHPDLAGHLISFLADDGFDVARSNQLRPEVGIGHAFSFVYRQLLPDGSIPMVPFMVNTYYPPNAPTPRRCYALGQALRRAIEAWDSDSRVAVVASGGLSHVIIDEDLDHATIDGLTKKDADQLRSLPVEKLVNGTSEIRNWVIAGGALEPLHMALVDYVPTYRSPAGTGCGMTFAYWK